MISTDFDALVERLDSPLIVVTTASNDQRAGCVVGFHTQCSIEPARYAVWLSKANFTYRVTLFATHLALHLLDAGDHALADLFGGSSGDDSDKFTECEWSPGPSGVPILTRCPNRIVLERVTLWDDGGDHVCVVGKPVGADADATTKLTPLRLSATGDIQPGHASEERATPDDLAANGADQDEALGTMTDADLRRLEETAAGAGHPIDLGQDGPG